MDIQTNFIIWKQILEIVEAIEQLNRQGQAPGKDLMDLLESLQTRTQPWSDPVENLELFAVHRLCRALRKFLDAMNSNRNSGSS